ncbi:hypothetical protein [Vibrio brasiliensis]
MKLANITFVFILLWSFIASASASASEVEDLYYQKIEQCVNDEQRKKDLTARDVTPEELKYIPIVRSLRVERCSKIEESNYVQSFGGSKIPETISTYNNRDLSALTKGELETIRNIDERLESYNLEVDLLSIYDKLKVE